MLTEIPNLLTESKLVIHSRFVLPGRLISNGNGVTTSEQNSRQLKKVPCFDPRQKLKLFLPDPMNPSDCLIDLSSSPPWLRQA